MKKNVYSLVLSEGVVDAVDALAYRRGMNRSALINQILAEYVSYTTPEMRMRRVFDSVDALLDEAVFRKTALSESMLTLRSSLAYKYRPTVRYSVELYREGDALGLFKATLRSQNDGLIQTAERFFFTFAQVERRYIGEGDYRLEGEKFTRALRLRVNRGEGLGMLSGEGLGELIADYINMFDSAMKAYFACEQDPEGAFLAVDRIYRDYLMHTKELI